MILHDNSGHSSSPAMPHVRGMGACFLSPSHLSLLPGYGRGATEEPQPHCCLVSLCGFLPNPLSSSAQSKQVRSLHGDVLPGLAHPHCPSTAVMCLGLCCTL